MNEKINALVALSKLTPFVFSRLHIAESRLDDLRVLAALRIEVHLVLLLSAAELVKIIRIFIIFERCERRLQEDLLSRSIRLIGLVLLPVAVRIADLLVLHWSFSLTNVVVKAKALNFASVILLNASDLHVDAVIYALVLDFDGHNLRTLRLQRLWRLKHVVMQPGWLSDHGLRR